MYSSKVSVNILTSLLIKAGVEHAVVCPGSRNSPIVHNLNECDEIQCYPVTDERSAGFFAMGICQQVQQPVVLCVTSGTALLNTCPAVAEAYYQHLPLIVISADRPAMWIDQLDGQTLPQPDALGKLVKKVVNLPEPHTDDEHWYCNRLVNEALQACRLREGGPVHINVPLSEPLYEYTVEQLPDEHIINSIFAQGNQTALTEWANHFTTANRPMVVIGQLPKEALQGIDLQLLSKSVVILKESLSPGRIANSHFEKVLAMVGEQEELRPDTVIYVGDCLVSKRLKKFLRSTKIAEIWTANAEGAIHDTFMHLDGVIEATAAEVLGELVHAFEKLGTIESSESSSPSAIERKNYHEMWHHALQLASSCTLNYQPRYSSTATVKYLHEQLEDMMYDYKLQYGNSSAIRLANIYADDYVYCNRGVNGIEGSLSTAAGRSAATDDIVFCVLGDLSFFYDQNALWNQNLKGNLRVIILNNHCGGIFGKFDGLRKSAARDRMVMGYHHSEAKGICTQNDCGYLKATNMEEMQLGIVQLLTMQTNRPVVLEVFTQEDTDVEALKAYFSL